MLKLKLQYFSHLMQIEDSLKETLMLGNGLSTWAATKSLTKGVISLSLVGLLYCFIWTTGEGTKKQNGKGLRPHSHLDACSVQLLSCVRLYVTP